MLVLLDLLTAFDTIDHQMLLERLHHLFGVTESALAWISSYLNDRYQMVTVDGEISEPVLLEHGVLLEDIIKHHKFHADDIQLLISFRPRDIGNQNEALNHIDECIDNISTWMKNNMLKLNNEETEVLSKFSIIKVKLQMVRRYNIYCG